MRIFLLLLSLLLSVLGSGCVVLYLVSTQKKEVYFFVLAVFHGIIVCLIDSPKVTAIS